uniref:Uncharacterized protein n=1 Tax=Anopheles quadriannulatus TaxID=34691 RepID=A0A182XTE8_ANOQN
MRKKNQTIRVYFCNLLLVVWFVNSVVSRVMHHSYS